MSCYWIDEVVAGSLDWEHTRVFLPQVTLTEGAFRHGSTHYNGLHMRVLLASCSGCHF